MMKVSFFMLLAMALAATAVHARLDLFAIGQLLTPNTQPGQNVGCQKIPFLLCDRVCDGCICDRRVSEVAECTCAQWKPFGEHPRSDGAQVQVIEKEKSQITVESASGTIPYTECIKTCDECFCTMMWPPESNVCICNNHKKSKKPAAVAKEVIDGAQVQMIEKEKSQITVESASGTIPYTECIKTCDECFCTMMWPPESNVCFCNNHKKSKKPAAVAEEVIDGAQVQVIEKEKSQITVESASGTIPYTECIKTCDICFCTLKWPPESNVCICNNNRKSKKPAAVAEEVTAELHSELDLVSKPVAKSVGGWIPYPKCMKKCDECVICTKNYPIEAALCYCGKKTASNSKKPALEYAEKLLTKLDVVAIPVAKPVGGFIPYPECTEKCDECVICTLIYPIEKALCYCGMKTKAEGRALPISLSE
ncbi:uncharacterized protein LOC126799349 isoform X7 [Argentina anserina]|uniref:uncharacterized protein LOC126799349 isoform X6 n=1 Tax=Argentina anserina TaxID=57926 RepID=UPI00217681D6|nr:uncharacterized protein LOC126799349 isoform X6 [Potentilla anserina]XP_050382500.1 uncharacterized protein LOC126799349 isoform X7 [Potentilla anserina]